MLDYRLDDRAATITLDDGKVNALSITMLGAVNDALDRAQGDAAAVVVLRGRDGVLSAGFDLATLRGGGFGTRTMVRAGFELAERLLAFPLPVVIACPGHAIAMGCFLLLSGDYRIGVDGPFRIQANEVAIGLTLPHAATEILRQRLTPAAFTRAAILAEPFSPADAVAAGFLDRVVAPDAFDKTIDEVVVGLAALDAAAHRGSKARARATTLRALRAAIDADVNASAADLLG